MSVNSEPLSARKETMFTTASRKTFALASLADSGRPLFKVTRIDRGNYPLALAICEAVLHNPGCYEELSRGGLV